MAIVDHLARRTIWLNVFLWSIAVNAALGIWALLVDDFGQTQGKVLATSFLVSATMVGILVNAAPLRDRVLWPLPLLAIAASTTGFVLLIALLWTEPDSDSWPRLVGSILTVAAGATLAGLLGLLALQERHLGLRLVALIAIGLLCATIVYAIWADSGADWLARVIGIESVVVAALTLALPAISRFLPPGEVVPPGEIAIRHCPACTSAVTPLVVGGDAFVCTECGLRFRVLAGVDREGAAGGSDR